MKSHPLSLRAYTLLLFNGSEIRSVQIKMPDRKRAMQLARWLNPDLPVAVVADDED
jgi:hypothetical protein